MTSFYSIPDNERGVILRFDRFELFPKEEELRKRGTLIRLSPQPFYVLHMLVSRPGEVITREEIQQALWGSDTFVDYEQGINAVIRRIRYALDDQAETPRFLETLPRRGYRFIATVERVLPQERAESPEAGRPAMDEITQPEMAVSAPVESLPAELSGWRAFLASAGSRHRGVRVSATLAFLTTMLFAVGGSPRTPGLVMPNESPVRVAVSTFRPDASPTATMDLQSVTRELRTYLSRIQPQRIHVVDAGAPADLLIDGTLQTANHGLHVNARITDGKTGRRILSETYHRPEGDVRDFPLEIALRVTRAVAERYVPPARHEPLLKTAVSAKALELYREGRAIRMKQPPQRDLNRAVLLFETALALEPRFSEAWSAIGDVWAERALTWRGASQRTALTEARSAFKRALEIDPACAEAHNDLGLLLMNVDRSYPEAEQALRRAIAYDPGYIDGHFNLALLLVATGQTDDAVAHFRRVQQLDPRSHVPSQTLAFIYMLGNRNREATAELRGVRLVHRRPDLVSWDLMWTAMGEQHWDDAAHWLSELLGKPVRIPSDTKDPGALFRKELRRLEDYLVTQEKTAQWDPYGLACFYSEIGEPDQAFEALDRALEGQSPRITFVFVDPRLDLIRRDVRFNVFLERLRKRS